MSMLIHPGDRGVDCSFTKPPAHRVRELGYSFLVGYESEAPSNPAKNLNNPLDYIAEGCGVGYVWEMNATRSNGGYSVGQHDGATMRDKMMRRGLPADCPVMAANDTNTTAANIGVHVSYMEGFWQELAPLELGEYADGDLLEATEGMWKLGWLPNAWSWSGVSRAASDARARALGVHVLQRTGFYIDNRYPVDPNEVINPFRVWGNAPVTQEADSMLIRGVPGGPHSDFRGDYSLGVVMNLGADHAALGFTSEEGRIVADAWLDAKLAAGLTGIKGRDGQDGIDGIDGKDATGVPDHERAVNLIGLLHPDGTLELDGTVAP